MSQPRVKGFGPKNAKVMIIGEEPSRRDVLTGEPYQDQAGKELTKMLHEAGFLWSECYITTVAKTHYPDPMNKLGTKRFFTKFTKMYQVPKPEILENIEELHQEIEQIKPDLIISLGDFALWTLSGEQGITKWRGSVLETQFDIAPTVFDKPHNGVPWKVKFIPTYSPARIMNKWDWRYIAVQDLRRAKDESAFPEVKLPKYDFIIRPDFNTVMEVLDGLLQSSGPEQPRGTFSHDSGRVTWPGRSPVIWPERRSNQPDLKILSGDIETRGGHIACLGIGWSDTEAICIPFMCVENNEGYWNEAEESAIVWKLIQLFRSPRIGWIFQNGLYDYQYLGRHWGVLPRLYMDTMLAQHTCFSGLPKGLDFISSMYCKFHRYWKDEGKEFHESIKTTADEEKYWIYNCKDCAATFESATVLESIITQLNQWEPYRFQMRQFWPVLKMMFRGVRTHRSKKEQLAEELLEAIQKKEAEINFITGEPLNVQSPKQMQRLFYEILKLPVQKNRKTKRPTTDDNALQVLKKKEPLVTPLIQRIAELRSLNVFLSTFIKAPTDTDGRMRSSYNIAGTETFRWSSSKDAFGTGMNLQNIPKGTED